MAGEIAVNQVCERGISEEREGQNLVGVQQGIADYWGCDDSSCGEEVREGVYVFFEDGR